jgi:hypothetical protein
MKSDGNPKRSFSFSFFTILKETLILKENKVTVYRDGVMIKPHFSRIFLFFKIVSEAMTY